MVGPIILGIRRTALMSGRMGYDVDISEVHSAKYLQTSERR